MCDGKRSVSDAPPRLCVPRTSRELVVPSAKMETTGEARLEDEVASVALLWDRKCWRLVRFF